MNEITIKFKTVTAAFDGENQDIEIAKILRTMATTIEIGGLPVNIFDTNGNRIGEFKSKGKRYK